MNIAGHTILTITQIANQVKYALERDFVNLWIQGEISQCKKYPSGHIYLTLKDEQSELSAVIFSQNINQHTIEPKTGQKVTVNGHLSLYSPKGKFQLQISNMYPIGQGKLWMAYEALKQKLEDEGLFALEKKKNIPRFPRQIGIITSSEGAVLRDIIHVLKRRAPHVSCLVYPVPVQGKSAGKKISIAIDEMNRYGKLDTLILGRGGGSLEDLWSFNDEKVIRSIYASKIPIISAVGHATDTTLSDYAADLMAPTPSSAAELVCADRFETIQLLDHYSEKLTQSIFQKISTFREIIGNYKKRHGFLIPQLVTQQMSQKLNEKNSHLKRALLHYLREKQNNFKLTSEKIQLLNPELQLKRGFSIATDERKNIVYSTSQIDIDDVVSVRVSRGRFAAKVIEHKEHDV